MNADTLTQIIINQAQEIGHTNPDLIFSLAPIPEGEALSKPEIKRVFNALEKSGHFRLTGFNRVGAPLFEYTNSPEPLPDLTQQIKPNPSYKEKNRIYTA